MLLALSVLLPAALFVSLLWGIRRHISKGYGSLGGLLAFGALLGVGCVFAERTLWAWTGLNISAGENNALGAVLAMVLFAAPLEESAKLLAVFPWLRPGSLRRRGDGILVVVAAATGLAASVAILRVLEDATPLTLLRTSLSSAGHVLISGAWGYLLSARERRHFLGKAWFAAMLLRGLNDHIAFGRGAGTLVFSVPLLVLTLAVGAWVVWDLRKAQRMGSGLSVTPAQAVSMPPPGVSPSSLASLARLHRRREQPLMLHWIVIGVFVTIGLALSLLVGVVFVGQEFGIDFSVADEADVRSNGPLILLGSAVLLSFPISGFLVTRACGARSVLESAVGAATAIGAIVALLSVAAPVAVVFVLAVAPVGFALTCAGAWFGLRG